MVIHENMHVFMYFLHTSSHNIIVEKAPSAPVTSDSCLLPRAVSDVLTNLKGIATEMGSELDRQNDQLGRLETKVDVNTGHLAQANRRIKRQL